MSTSTPSRPVLYLDFDGVLNFMGGRGSYSKRSGGLGYVRHSSVWAYKNDEGNYEPTKFGGTAAFDLKWSAELVRKLRALDADWLWLTTWKGFSPEFLDPRLDIKSDGWLDWYYGPKTDYSHEPKFDALLADQAANPRPFVWVDDVATDAFDAALLSKPVPHLVVKPDERTGMTMADLSAITAFVTEHGTN